MMITDSEFIAVAPFNENNDSQVVAVEKMPQGLIEIIENAAKNDLEVKIPKKRQIYNFFGNGVSTHPSKFTYADLIELLDNNSECPTDFDKPFVVTYQVKVDKFDDHPPGPPIPDKHFRFSLSTRRLLSVMKIHSKVIQADATYKLIWNGNPVLICGITDITNKFHPIMLAVCTCEESEDYQFLFQSIQDGLKRIGQYVCV